MTAIGVRACGDEDVTAGRGPGQRGWYEWASSHVRGLSVLDAGCGLGYGLDILARTAASATGQDLDPRLASDRVYIGPLAHMPAKSVDVVVSIDVIEHIEDDRGFLRELVRIARRRVLLTTPNWTAGRCTWPYHVREYTPARLRALCEPFGAVSMWKGTPDGFERYPIVHPLLNQWLNALRVHPLTAVPTRALNVALPSPAKIHSHLAVVLELKRDAM